MNENPAAQAYREKFNAIWNHFQNGYNPAIYDPERAAGFEGRKTSLAFAILIKNPEILAQIAEVAEAIRKITDVYVMPPDYYHITVKWLGFLTDQKVLECDIEAQTLEQILEQAEQIISRIQVFQVRLGRVNGLEGYIVLEAEDNGAIAQIQGHFHSEATAIPKYPLEGERWLPHMSIAGVKSKRQLDELKEKIKKIRNTEVGTIEVTHIDLLQAVLQKPYPHCQILQSFPLAPAVSS